MDELSVKCLLYADDQVMLASSACELHRKESQQSLARFRNAFENKTPCKTTTYKWFVEFKRGPVGFGDEFPDNCPFTVVNNTNIDSVRRMIETDRL
ncbi:hypothetical protein EVAR_14951_1 [Eumeta japonica]|uniref:Mos1 transposase HTH domain-containing protein n=1 Tax=Eumeta variegata TaxID=151549 RepID=A0A4C1XRC6_EUMVA|nr:hypothetical protein EVAR_14951_1 [Eumeta japonica]